MAAKRKDVVASAAPIPVDKVALMELTQQSFAGERSSSIRSGGVERHKKKMSRIRVTGEDAGAILQEKLVEENFGTAVMEQLDIGGRIAEDVDVAREEISSEGAWKVVHENFQAERGG
jgi:hypothetical protein